MKWMLLFCVAIASASPVAAAEPQVAESKLAPFGMGEQTDDGSFSKYL